MPVQDDPLIPSGARPFAAVSQRARRPVWAVPLRSCSSQLLESVAAPALPPAFQAAWIGRDNTALDLQIDVMTEDALLRQ
jgi:hypothetical protein